MLSSVFEAFGWSSHFSKNEDRRFKYLARISLIYVRKVTVSFAESVRYIIRFGSIGDMVVYRINGHGDCTPF